MAHTCPAYSSVSCHIMYLMGWDFTLCETSKSTYSLLLNRGACYIFAHHCGCSCTHRNPVSSFFVTHYLPICIVNGKSCLGMGVVGPWFLAPYCSTLPWGNQKNKIKFWTCKKKQFVKPDKSLLYTLIHTICSCAHVSEKGVLSSNSA